MMKEVPVKVVACAGTASPDEPGSSRCAFVNDQTVPGTRSVFDQGSEEALSEDAALFTHSCVASLPPWHLRKSSYISFHVFLWGVFTLSLFAICLSVSLLVLSTAVSLHDIQFFFGITTSCTHTVNVTVM